MIDIEKSETFLANWIVGEISENQLLQFKKTEDFELFSKIAAASAKFVKPSFNKKETFEKIVREIEEKRKKSNKKLKGKVFNLKRIIGVAASILFLVSTFYFINFNKTISTGFGEKRAYVLPDNSEVILNAKSSISFDKSKWKENRTLKLEGEAYFKVQKGSTFKVQTDEGVITVLGTQFTVLEDRNFLEVICYEGRVKVERNNNAIILTKGERFSQFEEVVSDNTKIKNETPTWLENETSFEKMPLKLVFNSLEKQYNVSILNKINNKNKLYTGSFVHDNLELALEAVLLPMNINYTISSDKKTVTLKQ